MNWERDAHSGRSVTRPDHDWDPTGLLQMDGTRRE